MKKITLFISTFLCMHLCYSQNVTRFQYDAKGNMVKATYQGSNACQPFSSRLPNDDVQGLEQSATSASPTSDRENSETDALSVPATLVEDVSIAPNPSSGETVITYRFSSITDLRIDILNSTGQVVTSNYLGKVQTGTLPINLNHLPSGTYFVRLVLPTQIKTHIVVLQL